MCIIVKKRTEDSLDEKEWAYKKEHNFTIEWLGHLLSSVFQFVLPGLLVYLT